MSNSTTEDIIGTQGLQEFKKNPWANVPVSPRSIGIDERGRDIKNPIFKGNGNSKYIPAPHLNQPAHGHNNRKATSGRPFDYVPREAKVPVGTTEKDGKHETVYARVKLNAMKKVRKLTSGMQARYRQFAQRGS